MGVASHSSDTDLRRTCHGVVLELIQEHGWSLLEKDAWVESVLDSIQSETSPAALKKAATHHYTIALYEACRQDADPDRRERAYHELFRYLFRVAYRKWPELAEDATQRALVLVYEQMDRCRNPGTFLAFALGKLQHAFQQERRARGRDWTGQPETVSQGTDEGDQAESPSQLGQQEERLQILVEAIRRLPDERQQMAIWLKFLAGWSDEEIAAYLRVTVSYVRVLRHRGLEQLREDEQLRDYLDIADSEEG